MRATKANWAGLDIDNDVEVRAFGKIAERAGREAVAGAIAAHKAAGNSIYFSRDGQIVKESADGRRFAVEFESDGSERIIEKLRPE